MRFDPALIGKDIIFQEDFFDFFNKIKKSKIELPKPSRPNDYDTGIENLSNDDKVTRIEKSDFIQLSPEEGYKVSIDENVLISAYDESIINYNAIEGKAICVAHSLVHIFEDQYYPINKLNILFITGSKEILNQIPGSIETNVKWGIDATANVKIAEHKKDFLEKHSHKDSILLIDGPFLAGDGLAAFKGIIKSKFLDQNILSIFIVKNSFSRLVVDSFPEYFGKFNSDLHYANSILREGQRTPFYMYQDTRDNSKVFCYLKFKKGSSPMRIEFPTSIFKKFSESINSAMDLIYYLILVQGDYNNPQVRPIAIAEKFAREVIKIADFHGNMSESQLTATMNEKRGMEF